MPLQEASSFICSGLLVFLVYCLVWCLVLRGCFLFVDILCRSIKPNTHLFNLSNRITWILFAFLNVVVVVVLFVYLASLVQRMLVPSRTMALAGATVKQSAQARPTKKVLQITPSAEIEIRRLLDERPDAMGLRIGVKKHGCVGKTFDIDYAFEKHRLDELVEQNGVSVIIENKAVLQILHSTMDFVESDEVEGFVFHNPQVKGVCGCGASFVV
eukprot:m.108296 g.108296  ORF g.108296 m.108296 type:complete len:214 (-) comp12703_c5_seq5:1542-2183(-)